MKLAFGLGTLVLSLSVFVAPAMAEDGFYVSGNVGISSASDSDWTDTWTGASASGSTSYDNGAKLTGAVGHSFGNMRLEGELSYSKNDLDSMEVKSITVAGAVYTGSAVFNATGDATSLGFMANGYYDFETDSKWTPFLMAGLGAARQSLDIKSVGGVTVTYDESDTVFAYQAGAGVAYEISPTLDLGLSYRYSASADPTFDDGVDKIKSEFKTHNFLIGITHRF